MRSKLTKTIILIVFVVFLGINDVNAETCTFSQANPRINHLFRRSNVTLYTGMVSAEHMA